MHQAKVGGSPTHEIAETDSNDITSMLACCEAEEENYRSQPEGERLCAAPFYFERVAILSRKAKDYQSEVEICRRWSAIARDYAGQAMVKNGMAAKVHLGPRSMAIKGRAAKAKELAAKARRQKAVK